jgi:peptidoglycan/LPS O-acetylase OafA/YrhL
MPKTTVHSSISYRSDIQGLRAIAIALVVLAHAHVPGFAGGFIGVDVFFVLSGYLITGLLIREQTDTGGIRYVRFLARRLKRLLPALLTMLILVLLSATLLLSAYEMRMQSGSFLFSATWTSNLFFAFVDRDYFSALQNEDLFLHTWSLGIEEQFYLVWPWLVSGSFLLLAARPGAHPGRLPLLGIFAVLFVASLLLCLYWSFNQPLLAFYMMPSRVWQFALGASVFVGFHSLGHEPGATTARRSLPTSSLLIGSIGLVLIVGSAVLLQPDVAYPGYHALFPSIGAAMAIAAGARSANSASRLLSHRYFVWLGDRSYSLYLWHWPVLILGNSFGLSSRPVGVALLVGFSIFLAMLSYRIVELPFWRGRFSKARPGRAILVSVLAMVTVIGAADALKRNIAGDSATKIAADDYDPRWDVIPGFYARRVGDFSCDTWYHDARLIPCGIGASTGESIAVLIGDSVGAQWSPLVADLFPSPDWQVIVLTKSSCAMVDESYYYYRVGGNYDVCTEWRNTAIDFIRELNPDVVFVGSGSHYDFSKAQWVDGTARVLERLTEAAGKVVVIPGTPTLSFDGVSCLEQPYRFSFRLADSRRECEEAQHTSTSTEVAAYLELSAADLAGASVLDLGDLVCPDGRCSASTEDGLVVFRDKQHLTMSFVKSLIPQVHERLVEMGVVGEPATESTSLEDTGD